MHIVGQCDYVQLVSRLLYQTVIKAVGCLGEACFITARSHVVLKCNLKIFVIVVPRERLAGGSHQSFSWYENGKDL